MFVARGDAQFGYRQDFTTPNCILLDGSPDADAVAAAATVAVIDRLAARIAAA